VDAYDVMTHAQPYKDAMSQEEALQELQKKAGSQFDPKLIAMLVEMVGPASFMNILPEIAPFLS
jgi:HD-GYP domain-containing protein (c-di-GMP phosphodiesterase class II)